MGNQHCCQAANKGQQKIQKTTHVNYNPQILPDLSQNIKKVLLQKKPFQQQLKAQPQIVTRQYGNQFYQGPIDIGNRPSGYGKMYKQNGALVISHFRQGITQGPSIIIFPDGSYYQGLLVNNRAEDSHGKYVCQHLTYEGQFHDNAFNGKGKQIGTGYTFEGDYIKGRKTKGTLKWVQNDKNYEYSGEFNQNFQFQNEGILKEQNIGTYDGTFRNGKKQGTGTYTYNNGMKYKGGYKNGLKHGAGTIYNFDDSIAYEGGFMNDLPNGQGYVLQNGKKVYAQFKDGLDVLTLPDEPNKKYVVSANTLAQTVKTN